MRILKRSALEEVGPERIVVVRVALERRHYEIAVQEMGGAAGNAPRHVCQREPMMHHSAPRSSYERKRYRQVALQLNTWRSAYFVIGGL